MAEIKKFEDIAAWQKARILSKAIYDRSNLKPFNSDFDLKSQIRRSSGSVMDNIAEGFERGGRLEFIQFLSISKASSAEVRSQLYRALDQNYITKQDFDELYMLSEEISKMLSSFISYLNKTEVMGEKFKNRSKSAQN